MAPEVKIGGVRLLGTGGEGVGGEEEGEALGWRWGVSYVYSNSWGPVDDGKTVEGPGLLLLLLL